MRRGRRGERGSVLLLVLSIIGLLVLISTTLTYTARLDVRAARSFRRGFTARMAALSGLDPVPFNLRAFSGVTATTQVWAQPMGLAPADDPNAAILLNRLQSQIAPSLRGSAAGVANGWSASKAPQAETSTSLEDFRPGTAASAASDSTSRNRTTGARRGSVPPEYQDTRARDLSGLLNINAAAYAPSLAGERALAGEGASARTLGESSAALDLEGFFAACLAESGVADGALASRLASEVLQLRYGSDGAPGVAGRDDNGDSRWGNPESDGLDNDGDGTIDNAEERLLSVALLDDELRWLRDSNDRLDRDPTAPTFSYETRLANAQPEGAVRRSAGDAERGMREPAANDAEGIDDPGEYQVDVRRKPAGDDRAFLSLDMIRALPSMTDRAWLAIGPHVSIFSCAPNTVTIGDTEQPRLNLNAAETDVVYERLRELYAGQVDERRIAQYAANLVDWRDPDATPTLLAYDGVNTVSGLEVAPFITEVYPDARTLAEDGDDGQYVEIFNPWDVAIDVEGWRLRVGNNTIPLKGTLPAEGYLIVTDDYNDENDEDQDQDSAGEYGSFFGIFKSVPNGGSRLLIESPQLVLSDGAGSVELFNKRGEPIDAFRWAGEVVDGTTQSYQRLQPSLAEAIKAPATPYDQNYRADRETARAFFRTAELDAEHPSLRRDTPFVDLADLLRVACAVADGDALVPDWSLPSFYPGDRPDARVLDQFYLGRPWPSQYSLAGLDHDAAQRVLAEASDASVVHGRININTASYPVLMALPGMPENVARRLIEQRQALELDTFVNDRGLAPDLQFRRPSDLLVADELWEGYSDAQRLERYGALANLITVSSLAFEVSTHYVKRATAEGTIGESAGARALVALDHPGGQLIDFRYLP